MVREVMFVDSLDWTAATERVTDIAKDLQKGDITPTVANRVRVYGLIAASMISVPMVFDYNCALWFNELFVHFSPPPEAELETWLEVGAWSWSWMEPPLGTFSFAVLCLQMARRNGSANPFAMRAKKHRREKTLAKFPQYAPMILVHFHESLSVGGVDQEMMNREDQISSASTSAL